MTYEELKARLHALGLDKLASGLESQRQSPDLYAETSFEERLGMLVEGEALDRENKAMNRRVQTALFRDANASLENLDYDKRRGLSKPVVAKLRDGLWLKEKAGVIITGPTGAGKTYLACALGIRACLQGYGARYYRITNLLEDLAEHRRADKRRAFIRTLNRRSLLIIDDFAHTMMSEEEQKDLIELVEDRYGKASTMLTSQQPVERWHAAMENPTLADAILDRLVHKTERIALQGEDSMRKR
jgi:DNA replication protein DnaC